MANKDLSNISYDPLDDFFGDFGKSLLNSVAGGNNRMKTDVIDHDDHYEVVSELPGFQKQDIDIQYSDDTLSIHAVHDLKKEVRDDDGHVVNQERRSSDVSRSFYLPDVQKDQISATYDGGLLKIELPKSAKEEQTSKSIDIN
ncbi:Molecular chaperone (small heat shock protein) [Fructilactobacillus florum 8D]|uniref:Molecular chaperone (Small heat shock protein) n=3 Tax=Fructilactobacillus florum TaxID=640331 RepID=W9EF14_9LACO|nr:Molecular chaperone (small heat shock protein) [Fructilactobacillus florum 2F]ETO40723.1 Molecular chaperone (small heat shock protein) [Fructilactobacillus florum 8D]